MWKSVRMPLAVQWLLHYLYMWNRKWFAIILFVAWLDIDYSCSRFFQSMLVVVKKWGLMLLYITLLLSKKNLKIEFWWLSNLASTISNFIYAIQLHLSYFCLSGLVTMLIVCNMALRWTVTRDIGYVQSMCRTHFWAKVHLKLHWEIIGMSSSCPRFTFTAWRAACVQIIIISFWLFQFLV